MTEDFDNEVDFTKTKMKTKNITILTIKPNKSKIETSSENQM